MISSQGFPETGEVVLATVESVSPSGAWVTLDEYGGLRAFLPESEVSRGRARSIDRILKPKQKVIVKVTNVDQARRIVDVSIKQLTQEEERLKRIEVKKSRWAESLFNIAAQKLGIKDVDSQIKLVLKKYESLYDAVEALLNKGADEFVALGINRKLAEEIYELAKERFAQQKVSIVKTLEIYSPEPDGIEVVKSSLISAISALPAGSAKVTYVSSPKYRLEILADDYKAAEKLLKRFEEEVERAGSGKVLYRIL